MDQKNFLKKFKKRVDKSKKSFIIKDVNNRKEITKMNKDPT